jgi:hypothetical protein
MEWWYADAGDQKGPIDSATLRQFVVQGTIGPKTLIWTEGMAQWMPAESVQELKDLLVRPPPLPQPGQNPAPTTVSALTAVQSTQPGSTPAPVLEGSSAPWTRFLAKFVDLYISIILIVATQVGLAFVSPAFHIWLQNHDNTPVLVIVGLLLTPFVEAMMAAVFGNSPGKALLGG